MAEAIAGVLEHGGMLICEAGTGTGKTFAYLVPALASGARVIVSTGTRTLQDQLFHRDLPLVRRALASGGSMALLKGRANYLCLQRLADAVARGTLLADGQRDLLAVEQWSGRTRSGDIAELGELTESSPVWPVVTSTAENCLGQECRYYDECFVVRARRAAAAADVVVVNHHLFLADMSLREEGFGEIVPSADLIIFDEAHQLPDLVAQFFGTSVSGRQLLELARDSVAAQAVEAGEQPEVAGMCGGLESAVADLRASFGGPDRRIDWAGVTEDCEAQAVLGDVRDRLGALAEALAAMAERGTRLANVARRAALLRERLAIFIAATAGDVRWVELHRRSFVLHRTPIDVATSFRARLRQYPCAWVFTSATLAVGEDFSFFAGRLGLEDAETRRWDSPYDYRTQALLYVPPLDGLPGEPGYTAAVCAAAVPVLAASAGRAFVLFTSHRALREAATILAARIPYPLLVQGEAPRAELLARFRTTPQAVLLGTASFWEGVDVRGEALSCVIIDKLPFAAPDDPVARARAALLREEGRNAFREFQLPEAVIALKQGVGRLIRDETDRGVLVLCDPRLFTRAYGRVFRAGLPAMTVTREIADVRAFFAAAGGAAGSH